MSAPIEPNQGPAAGATGDGRESAEAPTGGPRRRKARRSPFERWFGSRAASFIEWVLVIVGAIVLAVVVKVFLLQAFFIPSLSMYPTLHEGDRVLVNKMSYRLHDVNRGDIVVFERPASEVSSTIPDLIKRVIGLPGESVAFSDGAVFVDGNRIDESYLPTGTVTSGANAPYKCTLDAPCVVPEGDVWVMGDNRSDSKDSRYFGPIPESSIVGRAFVRVWPLGRFGLL